MGLTNDLQKSSTVNIAKFYPKDAILPLYLTTCNLTEDTNIFYTDLNKTTSLESDRIKTYYKNVTNFF